MFDRQIRRAVAKHGRAQVEQVIGCSRSTLWRYQKGCNPRGVAAKLRVSRALFQLRRTEGGAKQ